MNVNLNDVLQTTKEVALQTVALAALDETGVLKMIQMEGDGVIKSNLKRGFAWYLADEITEQVVTGDSNFMKMGSMEGWSNLLDDTMFYGVSSFVIEQSNLPTTVNSYVEQLPLVPMGWSQYVTAGTLLVAAKKFGRFLEDRGLVPSLTNVSQFVGLR